MDEADPLVAYQDALIPAAWVNAMQIVAQGTSGDSLLVIRGESGTGKDLLARMLHAASGRGSGPFVKVDCATRPAERLADRLFGHARNARPDASRRKLGAVEFAHGGTIFFDNIDALPPSLHPDVLAFLQRRTVASTRTRPVSSLDVRILLATRESLASGHGAPQISWGSPVLKVLDLQLAPLRARPGHIAPLAEFFLARFNAQYQRDACLSSEELGLLTAYSWPGNIRELQNEIRRFVIAEEPHSVSCHILYTAAPWGRQTA